MESVSRPFRSAGHDLARLERGNMGERRKARRYEVYLPLQVCLSGKRPAEFCTAQLRDISRSGIYFHSDVAIDPGAGIELTFALPAEREGGASVLVRASAKALRASRLDVGVAPVYGVAATIDRIDFVRPMITNAA
jgi:PilZ domain